MSTTATEPSTDTKTRVRTRQNEQSDQRAVVHLNRSVEATESAVSELVHGAVNAGVSLLPAVLVRPTATVEAVFSLAEQALSAVRKVAIEIASLVETGVDAAREQAA